MGDKRKTIKFKKKTRKQHLKSLNKRNIATPTPPPLAKDQPIPPHKQHIHTPLRQDVLAKMIPVYKRIMTSHLLESCKGDTQNNNESLHNIIWTELPKTKFFGLQRMLYGVHRGVTKFNLGHAAAEVEGSGLFATKAAKEKDTTRIKKCEEEDAM